MPVKFVFLLVAVCLASSCISKTEIRQVPSPKNPMVGTWRLLTATLIEKGDTTVTTYDKNISFIKIINDSHFAFLQHDLSKGKKPDAVFVSGGGKYSFVNNQYTEHLEYCSAREWEGNDFKFKITIQNDTLTQSGVEKVDDAGIDRINIERYARIQP